MRLSNPPARYGNGQADRIALELKNPCYCDGDSARLCVRAHGAGKAVRLQCETCGRGIGGAMPMALHPYAASYPEWDDALQDSYRSAAQGALSNRQIAWRAEQAKARQVKSDNYSEWLATSPAWRLLRSKVMKRAGLLCEACLVMPAEHVHHLTYDFGKLPPAWELRAVCAACHTRLHDGWADAEAMA